MEKFKKDLVRKELIPIKILMFLIYGGQATLYPYFTVHLKSLGVSIKQTAIIFAIQPIIALLVAPTVGLAADKIGNFKLIFCFFLTFSAVTANLLLVVPPVSQSEELHFNAQCNERSELTIALNKDLSCKLKHLGNNTYINTIVQFKCEHTCNFFNKSFYPLFITEEGGDCLTSCGTDVKSQCLHVNERTKLDFSVNSNDLDFLQIAKKSYFISYPNSSYVDLKCCAECKVNCTISSQNPIADCSDSAAEEFGTTFWSYLGIRLFVTLGIGLVNGLFDAASMTIIQDLKADVGLQRFWSTVGMCLFAPVSGYMVDTLGNYQPCFYMYGTLYLIAAITSVKLDLSMKMPAENPLKNLAKLLINPEVILLLIQIAVLGICWGFLENFLFWFLEKELGSNNLIMGLTVTVGSGTGLFMALVATWCTRKLGYVNVIIVAFAAYTVRFLGYSYATDAYTCLIFEMMENFTVTLLTVGVTLYCTELASLEMLTTIMTLWNGLHIISGRAFGSLLGGFLANNYGFRKTFRIFAYISCSFGAFYAIVYIFWLRKWREAHRKESLESREKNSVVEVRLVWVGLKYFLIWIGIFLPVKEFSVINDTVLPLKHKGSTLSEEKEEDRLKNEAFSCLPMHCSFDSPTIMHNLLNSPETEFRRRALSHIPVAPSNSFGEARCIPRHAISFSEGKTVPPKRILNMNLQDLKEFSDSLSTGILANNELKHVTKF